MISILIIVLLALCVYYVRINRIDAVAENDIIVQPPQMQVRAKQTKKIAEVRNAMQSVLIVHLQLVFCIKGHVMIFDPI